jgi:hypothetical protein
MRGIQWIQVSTSKISRLNIDHGIRRDLTGGISKDAPQLRRKKT